MNDSTRSATSITAVALLVACYSSILFLPICLLNGQWLRSPPVETKPELEANPPDKTPSYSKPPFDWNPAPNITLMIDLHTHTKFSDGSMWPIDLIFYQNSTGRNATAITDHDTIQGGINGSLEAAKWNVSMPIIVGEEWSGGRKRAPPLHIVMLFTNKTLETERFPEYAINAVEECHEMGGVAIWAHPWREYGDPEQQAYPVVLPYVDGIEWHPNHSAMILAMADEHDLFVVYSSDIHHPGQRKEWFSYIRVEDTSMECIKWSLRSGNTWLNVPNATNWANVTYPDGPGLYGRTWFGLQVGEKHCD